MKLNYGSNSQQVSTQVPLNDSDLVNKKYVDDQFVVHSANTSIHLTSAQNTWIDAITATATEVNRLTGVTSNVQPQLDSKLPLVGGTLTGLLTLSDNPTANFHAATKLYVDGGLDTKLNLTGGTLTGYLQLHAAPVSDTQASTKKYVDDTVSTHAGNNGLHVTPGQKTFLNELTVTSVQVNQLSGVSSNVQTQLTSKLNLAGGVMTGALTLSGAPTIDLHATTKKYTDDLIATRLPLAGGTMTGLLVLSGAPTLDTHAVTKKYSDDNLSLHATDNNRHLTTSQNAWIDDITVTATEVNYLGGTTANLQEQVDSKLPLAGGTLTGDLQIQAGKKILLSTAPLTNEEVVNKGYVDALVAGKKWLDPVSCSTLMAIGLNNPPAITFDGASYIVGQAPTGLWIGRQGRLVTYVDEYGWKTINSEPVGVGSRFGVRLPASSTEWSVDASLEGYEGKVITITGVVGSEYAFTEDVQSAGTSVLIYDEDAHDFGVTYTLQDEGMWTITNTSTNIVPGDGLDIVGQTIFVKLYQGLKVIPGDGISISMETDSGMEFNVNNNLQLKLDGTTLVKSTNGVKLSDTLNTIVVNAIRKDTANTITGQLNVTEDGKITYAGTITAPTDVTTKAYVDAADTTLTNNYNAMNDIVTTLNADPVTRNYVNTELAKKLSLAGGTMTGALVLSADPTNVLHAATKQYVDTGISSHTNNNTIHVTAAQRTLLDNVTATAAQINYLTGVTSNVQIQLNAKVNLAGGTMTGALTLNGVPTLDGHAANKDYVDQGLATKVNLSGGTMTGALVLSEAPTTDLQASTKKYVDDTVTGHAGNATLHLTASQNTWIDAITASSGEVNYLGGVTSPIQTQINSRLSLAGGTMTGFITLHALPTLSAHATSKQYVDDGLLTKLSLSGGTMTGALKLAGDPVAPEDAVSNSYLNTRITSANSYTDTEAVKKVAKAGDTMTGFLTLHADPSSALHASPKQYVDNSISTLSTNVSASITTLQGRATALETTVNQLNTDPVTKTYVDAGITTSVAKSGSTMTGFLTLNSDPVNALHAATKQYVDAIAMGLSVKASIRLATTANLAAVYSNGSVGVNATLTGSSNGALTVDTKAVRTGDRILVRMQTLPAQNGDYVVTQPGDAGTPFILKRATTVDESAEVPGSYFHVYDGSINKGTGWVFTVGDVTTFAIGTDPITVNQFFGPGAMVGGNGIDVSGNVIAVKVVNSGRLTTTASGIDLATCVSAGTYRSVSVDLYGRVTAGTNPTTLAGYAITDAQPLNTKLTNVSSISTRGLVVVNAADVVTTRALAISGSGITLSDTGVGDSSTPITITSNATAANTASTIVLRDASGNFIANNITAELTGNASTATVLQTARNFSISGDVTAPVVSFNGSTSVTLSATLANSGVAAGTYRSVTVDAKGRVTGGTNPNTIAGYGITDAQPLNSNLTAFSAIAARGLLVMDSSDTPKVRKVGVSGTGLSISDDGTAAAAGTLTISSNATNVNVVNTVVARDASGNFAANIITAALSGNSTTSTTLQTTRTFAVTGDVTAPAQNFNGSANVSLTATLANSGVTAGTYKSVTVDAKGRVTGGTNPTTLAGYGITDAVTITQLNDTVAALQAQIAELHAYIINRM